MNKRSKVVATLGPASSTPETLAALLEAGVNVFRINFSHGTADGHRDTIAKIRKVLKETGRHAAILADLQGPKLRVGDVAEGVVVEPGDLVTFINEPCEGTAERVYMTYQKFAKDVKVGEQILLDDGKLVMEVTSTNNQDEVVAKVIQGGPLKSKKGVNLPNTRVSLPCLTEKDLEDLAVALDEGVDWIGLSFVRRAEDVVELRKMINRAKSHAGIISKIEKPEAVSDIDRILEATDAVMIARGDLGVEVPMESVPLIQKMIIEKSIKAAKPVIVATQMMETMIDSMTPTRAEVNDVANAILDGADAVMLSGETSVGQYPVEVVKTMSRIAKTAENATRRKSKFNKPDLESQSYMSDEICYHSAKVANQIGARAITTMTFSGRSAQVIASYRPMSDIYAFTANEQILNKLSLYWGVRGFFYDSMESTDKTLVDIQTKLTQEGLLDAGDRVVQIVSMPIAARGTTNTLHICEL